MIFGWHRKLWLRSLVGCCQIGNEGGKLCLDRPKRRNDGFIWFHNMAIPSIYSHLVVLALSIYIHPGRLTWNLQITHLERKMIFQTSMIMFHVNLPGCTGFMINCEFGKFCKLQCFKSPPGLYRQTRFFVKILSSWRMTLPQAGVLLCQTQTPLKINIAPKNDGWKTTLLLGW